jgi:hypothetical protein
LQAINLILFLAITTRRLTLLACFDRLQ